jgi:hypothetical protein
MNRTDEIIAELAEKHGPETVKAALAEAVAEARESRHRAELYARLAGAKPEPEPGQALPDEYAELCRGALHNGVSLSEWWRVVAADDLGDMANYDLREYGGGAGTAELAEAVQKFAGESIWPSGRAKDALAFRDALDRARDAAQRDFFEGLSTLVLQARRTGDTDLELAAWTVCAELDTAHPSEGWREGVEAFVAREAEQAQERAKLRRLAG